MITETMDFLAQYDPEVGATVKKEYERQQRNIELIASENIVENKTVRNLWENAVRYNKIVYAPTHVFGS